MTVKKEFIIGITIIISATLFSFTQLFALAILGIPSIPGLPSIGGSSNLIGGKIEKSERCDILCTESFQGHLIRVSNPNGGDFITDFSSKVYRENKFSVGNYVVGLAEGGEKECKGVTKKKAAGAVIRCFFGDCNPKNACADHGTGRIIKIIGTSK